MFNFQQIYENRKNSKGSWLHISVNILKSTEKFLLWRNGIGSISAAPEHRFDPLAWHNVVKDLVACGSDVISGPGTPYAMGQPKD